MIHFTMSALVVGALAIMATPVWAQTSPPIQNGQVEIVGALPRTNGEVNVEALKQTIQTQFARPGVQEVQFRNVSLTAAEQRVLFLDSDRNKNLLLEVSVVVPSPNGAERSVTFRSNDFRAKVGREEGQLRARIEGIDQSQLTEAERQSLRAQFDRLRLEGVNDRGGNRADNRGDRGRSDNSGPGSGNSGRGSDNSGPGSANSGPSSANSGSGRGGDNSGRGGRGDNRAAQAGDVRQEDRRADRREDRQLDRREDRREDRRANTGGELRGLDRADHMAGEHGQQGRDNARVVQMERPNRPERVERPQRPERPEKPERAGRS